VSVREAMVRHWPLKLAALALSAILWVVVSLDEPATHLEDIRLQLALAPSTALVLPVPPIQAVIAGPRREFLKLTGAPLLVHVAIPDSVTGAHHHLVISPSDVELPRDVKVTVEDVVPREIDLVLDRRAEKSVPVALRAVVEPEAGYALDGPLEVAPDQVTVSGARSLLSTLDSVATAPVQVRGVAGAFTRIVPLDTTGHAVLRMVPAAVTLRGRTSKT
jgi:hypothetical protein